MGNEICERAVDGAAGVEDRDPVLHGLVRDHAAEEADLVVGPLRLPSRDAGAPPAGRLLERPALWGLQLLARTLGARTPCGAVEPALQHRLRSVGLPDEHDTGVDVAALRGAEAPAAGAPLLGHGHDPLRVLLHEPGHAEQRFQAQARLEHRGVPVHYDQVLVFLDQLHGHARLGPRPVPLLEPRAVDVRVLGHAAVDGIAVVLRVLLPDVHASLQRVRLRRVVGYVPLPDAVAREEDGDVLRVLAEPLQFLHGGFIAACRVAVAQHIPVGHRAGEPVAAGDRAPGLGEHRRRHGLLQPLLAVAHGRLRRVFVVEAGPVVQLVHLRPRLLDRAAAQPGVLLPILLWRWTPCGEGRGAPGCREHQGPQQAAAGRHGRPRRGMSPQGRARGGAVSP
mmetsp:Transcript_12026/g.33750  ORF Transcript_12026/g.33750 Transcript_12026/m.33750 type:complete len:394 (+) Transcript_12026:269-1450(+)